MKKCDQLFEASDGLTIGLVSMMVLMLFMMGCNSVRACEPAACGDDSNCSTCTPCGTCAVETACPMKVAEQPVKPAEITTPVLETLLRSGVKVTVLDARTGKFDDGNRIPSARSLSPEANAEAVTAALPAKDSLVVTYCAGVKCPASRKLAEHLKKLGYTNVLEYPEGIAGWKDSGNAVEVAKEK